MSSSILGLASNVSILSIPIYYVLCIAPHGYAVSIGSKGNPGTWPNNNPRGSTSAIKSKLSAEAYARFERAEAAHHNSLESFPLFTAAIILGNVARLPVDELNRFAIGIMVLRIAYILAYINISRRGPSYLRTLIWFAGVAWIFRTIWTAGLRLA